LTSISLFDKKREGEMLKPSHFVSPQIKMWFRQHLKKNLQPERNPMRRSSKNHFFVV